MGIPLSSLSEGCCEELNSLPKVKLDEYKENKSMSSVDNVLECDDKYIFIEEKSFLLDYYRLAGERLAKKPISEECGMKFIPASGEISVDFLDCISKLDISVKKELMYKACMDKTLSHDDKLRDTLIMLCKDDKFCNEKLSKSITIYLYCNTTGLDQDQDMSSYISLIFGSYGQREKTIACNKLTRFLEKQKCS